jgi:hypothetical protein
MSKRCLKVFIADGIECALGFKMTPYLCEHMVYQFAAFRCIEPGARGRDSFRAKPMNGKVDFIEVAQGAVRALGEPDMPTDLALTLDYRLRHLLIDEFQDTSISQFELVSKLTTGWELEGGRTIYLIFMVSAGHAACVDALRLAS